MDKTANYETMRKPMKKMRKKDYSQDESNDSLYRNKITVRNHMTSYNLESCTSKISSNTGNPQDSRRKFLQPQG